MSSSNNVNTPESAANGSVVIGLNNPKSPTNVGSVMRAMRCFSGDAVVYTGQRYDKAVKFQTDTKQEIGDISLSRVDCLLEAKPKGAAMVCVELCEGAISLPEFEHPKNAYYVFGPEDGSVSQKLVNQADAVVYIPTQGCLNLAATVNVVLYDRQAKLGVAEQGDELVCRSRDKNNRLRV